MSKKLSILLLVILSINVTSFTQQKPKHADEILKSAISQANYYNKNVLVIFHSTWCGWCKKLIKVVNASEISSIFSNHFVVTYIDVRERGEMIKLVENPGGQQLMSKLGGANSGIPYYVFLDSKGNVMASEDGYPRRKGVPGFVARIKRSAKNIDNGSLNKIAEFMNKVTSD